MGGLRMGVLVTGCPKKNPYDSHTPKLLPKLITDLTDGGDNLDLVLCAVVDTPGEGNGWPVRNHEIDIVRALRIYLSVASTLSVCQVLD